MSKVSIKLNRRKTVFEPIDVTLSFVIEDEDELVEVVNYFNEQANDAAFEQGRLINMLINKLKGIEESL